MLHRQFMFILSFLSLCISINFINTSFITIFYVLIHTPWQVVDSVVALKHVVHHNWMDFQGWVNQRDTQIDCQFSAWRCNVTDNALTQNPVFERTEWFAQALPLSTEYRSHSKWVISIFQLNFLLPWFGYCYEAL